MNFFKTANKKVLLIMAIVVISLLATGIAVYGMVLENNRNIEAANRKIELENDLDDIPIVVPLDDNIDDKDEIVVEIVEEVKEEVKNESNTQKQENTSNNNVKNNSKYYIKVNNQANVVTVYTKDEKGEYTKPVKAMLCSTGSSTPTSGKYSIPGRRSRWRALYGNVYGQYVTNIVGAILFHSVPYLKVDPSTLKYGEYNKLGTSASMGCVRLRVTDAKWIYENIGAGTIVEFYSSSNPGPLGKPSVVKISESNVECRGWDPTDPDQNNPWRNVKEEVKKEEPKEEENKTNTVVEKGVDNKEKNTNTITDTKVDSGKEDKTNTVVDTKEDNSKENKVNDNNTNVENKENKENKTNVDDNKTSTTSTTQTKVDGNKESTKTESNTEKSKDNTTTTATEKVNSSKKTNTVN